MKNINKTQLGNYVCAFMCLLVLISQFLPFWNCTNCKDHEDVDKAVSIAGYVWRPDHHKPITKGMTDVYLEAYGEDLKDENGKKFKFAVDDIVLPCVVIFVGSIVGLVLSLAFSHRVIGGIITAIAGGVGTYWYLTCPAMKVGINWQLHLVITALAAILSLACIIYNIASALKEE